MYEINKWNKNKNKITPFPSPAWPSLEGEVGIFPPGEESNPPTTSAPHLRLAVSHSRTPLYCIFFPLSRPPLLHPRSTRWWYLEISARSKRCFTAVQIALQASDGAGRRFLSSILREKLHSTLSGFQVRRWVNCVCHLLSFFLCVCVEWTIATQAEAHLISVPSSVYRLKHVLWTFCRNLVVTVYNVVAFKSWDLLSSSSSTADVYN